jgi:hypothetical protein
MTRLVWSSVCWQVIKERKLHYSARSHKGMDKIMGEDKELGERQPSNVVTLSICYIVIMYMQLSP